jgi:hypothetical protein
MTSYPPPRHLGHPRYTAGVDVDASCPGQRDLFKWVRRHLPKEPCQHHPSIGVEQQEGISEHKAIPSNYSLSEDNDVAPWRKLINSFEMLGC